MKQLFFTSIPKYKHTLWTVVTVVLIFVLRPGRAQNVAINTTGNAADASSMLEVTATDKGILIPRVALTAINSAAPVTSPATSLLVYNTATAGTAPNNVVPGYYYWNGSLWVFFLTQNIYTADGTLAGDRTVIVGGKTLDFKTESPNTRETKIDHSGSGNILYQGTSTGDATIQLQAGSSLLNIGQHTNNEAFVTAGTATANTTGLSVGTASSSTGNLILRTAGTNRMVIQPDGKVSIRALAPGVTGTLLTVNGTIETANSVYPDYVFEDYFNGFSELKSDYSFKSLKEAEDFINKNKHLPGVTGIKSLLKNEKGDYVFNLSELSIQMLEKIEELYLYSIEQQKRIDMQQAEIKALKEEAETIRARLEKLEKMMSGNGN